MNVTVGGGWRSRVKDLGDPSEASSYIRSQARSAAQAVGMGMAGGPD